MAIFENKYRKRIQDKIYELSEQKASYEMKKLNSVRNGGNGFPYASNIFDIEKSIILLESLLK